MFVEDFQNLVDCTDEKFIPDCVRAIESLFYKLFSEFRVSGDVVRVGAKKVGNDWMYYGEIEYDYEKKIGVLSATFKLKLVFEKNSGYFEFKVMDRDGKSVIYRNSANRPIDLMFPVCIFSDEILKHSIGIVV